MGLPKCQLEYYMRISDNLGQTPRGSMMMKDQQNIINSSGVFKPICSVQMRQGVIREQGGNCHPGSLLSIH